MLKTATLTNWKSFGEVRNELPFAPLTFLVGPNASGKSNVLDALRFLQGAALGYPMIEVLTGRREGGRTIWPGIRGNAVEAARLGQSRFQLAVTWDNAGVCSEHRIKVSTGDPVEPISEWLSIDGKEWLSVDSGSLTLGNDDIGSVEDAPSGRSALAFVSGVRSGDVPRPVLEQIMSLTHGLRGVTFLDIQPSRMREYHPIQDTALSISGENISPVLAKLEAGAQADIADWVHELCSGTFSGLDFDRTQLQEVMLYAKEQSGRRISVRSMSDGTLRFLGLVTAVVTAAPGSILILEEPDTGLHPSRTHLLVDLFENVGRARSVQIIATTHSATLLGRLTSNVLGDALMFARDADSGTTHSFRIGDLPHFHTLRDSNKLEHLISTGWLEHAT